MRFRIHKLILSCLALLLLGQKASAGTTLTLSPSGNTAAGQQLYLLNFNPQYFYGIYWINASVPSDDSACAYITGGELATDNNLTHYGTCFVNDQGTFKIVELTVAYYASYTDAKNSAFSTNNTMSFVVNKSFPIPGTPTLVVSAANNTTVNRRPAVSVPSCAVGYTVRLYSDAGLLASGLCPAGGMVQLTPGSDLAIGLVPLSATQVDQNGAESFPSNALLVTILQRARRVFSTK